MNSKFRALFQGTAGLLLFTMLVACGGGGSGTTPAPSVPVVTLSAAANLNGTTDLNWSSTNATSCTLTGSTSGAIGTSGKKTITSPINDSQSYSLSCSGTGGSATASATATPPASFSTTCLDGSAPQTVQWIGSIVVMNNRWGYNGNNAISPINHTQCVSGSVGSDGTIKTDWNWSFDVTSGIKSYPSFAYGVVSDGWSSTTKALPAAVSTLSSTLGLNYTQSITGTNGSSAYNFLVDLYFNKSSFPNNDLEMSINQVCIGACYGPVLDTVTIGGVTYIVNYGVGGSGKAQLSFSSLAAPQYASTLTFKPFIDYAIAKGYLNNAWYLGQITVGNEVYAGVGAASLTAKFIQ